MITVDEIRKKSERKYDEILQRFLKGDNCFPLTIRSNKKLSRNFGEMSQELAEVFSASKDRRGFGYSVLSETISTRQHGVQDIPQSISFETLNDYLRFIAKEKEFQGMLRSYEYIISELPELKDWAIQNPKLIILNSKEWPDLLKVCAWFLYKFEPYKYYIRELPIAVHTKFIEENKPILRVLLDELIPGKIDPAQSDFEKRFRLNYVQPLVRYRSLDNAIWKDSHYDDLTVPLDQFAYYPVKCDQVFVIENKMNFLTFPPIARSIVIWGKGFGIECLKEVKWLTGIEIFYWSDLDVQGFQMLSQLRAYFPQAKSLFMEMEVLASHNNFVVQGTLSKVESLPYLSNDESEVYLYLLKNNLRLEQERIPQSLIIKELSKKFEF